MEAPATPLPVLPTPPRPPGPNWISLEICMLLRAAWAEPRGSQGRMMSEWQGLDRVGPGDQATPWAPHRHRWDRREVAPPSWPMTSAPGTSAAPPPPIRAAPGVPVHDVTGRRSSQRAQPCSPTASPGLCPPLPLGSWDMWADTRKPLWPLGVLVLSEATWAPTGDLHRLPPAAGPTGGQGRGPGACRRPLCPCLSPADHGPEPQHLRM